MVTENVGTVLTRSPGVASLEALSALRNAVGRIIRGKDEVIDLSITCLLAEGHLLLDDVPGVGKTSLARSLAAALGLQWQRIQFTPDVLPSDITGVSIYHQATSTFEFHPGPVFTSIVLADEINRASPRTQSALLEAMEERNVTVDGMTRPLPSPFMVIATQNPVDMAGTYPLPEAQLDRFLMRCSLGYPAQQHEVEIENNYGPNEIKDETDINFIFNKLKKLKTQKNEEHRNENEENHVNENNNSHIIIKLSQDVEYIKNALAELLEKVNKLSSL